MICRVPESICVGTSAAVCMVLRSQRVLMPAWPGLRQISGELCLAPPTRYATVCMVPERALANWRFVMMTLVPLGSVRGRRVPACSDAPGLWNRSPPLGLPNRSNIDPKSDSENHQKNDSHIHLTIFTFWAQKCKQKCPESLTKRTLVSCIALGLDFLMFRSSRNLKKYGFTCVKHFCKKRFALSLSDRFGVPKWLNV